MSNSPSYLLTHALKLIECRRKVELHIPLLAFRPVQIRHDGDDPLGQTTIGTLGDGTEIRFRSDAILAVMDAGALG